MDIILASGSPRRKKLFEQINLTFTVEVSDANEEYPAGMSPSGIVQELALRKAEKIATEKKDSLVIGADTIVVFEDEILEKPTTTEEAVSMLLRLSSNTHQVLTGVGLVKVDKTGMNIEKIAFFEKTNVTFGNLTKEEIEAYVETGSPMDKAGAYGIQDDWGALFVKKIEGDYYNVVGFPLHSFYTTLKECYPELIPQSVNLTHES